MSDIQSIYQNLISLLESQETQLRKEIHTYPPPIPACDAQFNYLLEKRDRLPIELNRLHKLSQQDEFADALVTFLETSTLIQDDVKERFLFSLLASQE